MRCSKNFISLFSVPSLFLNPLLLLSVVFITAVLTRGTISLFYSLLWVCKDLRDVAFVIRGYRICASHIFFFLSLRSIKNCLKFHDTAESPAEWKNAGMINKMWCWSRGMCKIFLSSLQKFQVCLCRIFCKHGPRTKLHAGRSCPLRSWVLANSPPKTFLAIFKCTAPPVELKANSNTDKLLCQLRRHKHHAAVLSIGVLRCASVVQGWVVFGLRVSTLAFSGFVDPFSFPIKITLTVTSENLYLCTIPSCCFSLHIHSFSTPDLFGALVSNT